MLIYPNPTAQAVQVEGAEGGWMQLFDLEGRLSWSQQIGGDAERVHLPRLQPGIYVVRITKGVQAGSQLLQIRL